MKGRSCQEIMLLMMFAMAAIMPSILAFTTICPIATTQNRCKPSLMMKAEVHEGSCSRREAIQAVGATIVGTVFAANVGVTPAFADISSVNQRLTNYGLPQLTSVPNGMRPLLEIYGKDEIRETLLVGWNYPNGWIVQRPNNDLNYEAGTVSTGDYGKGDSAFLWVGAKDLAPGGSIDKAAAANILRSAIGQKGENQFQNFVLKTFNEGASGLNGQKYYVCRFKYELLTGAGFSIDRDGYASLTTVGGGVQAVVSATTSKRFKNLEPMLKEIADSFRVYTGIIK